MLNKVLAGRFRITGLLGSGGMGQVWAAQDERMRREVAVKIVHPQYGMDEAETQARFQREVQLAGRLAHQNIVTVHDWGEVEVEDRRRTLYHVMELVRGVPLHKRLKEVARAPWPLAVGWAAQITQALDAAHRQGVVHRDIKPANVLLTADGMVKVLDFGIAKFMGDTIGARELTVTGAPLGSPMYMSPEQAQGAREIDHRSDLYSLGCLLYHAVTGAPPFASATQQWAVLRMQIEDPPTAPGERAVGLPAPLNDLILSLLAKRPEDRPGDAEAVHEALVTILLDGELASSGGGVLDLAQFGHGASLPGRFLKEARARANIFREETLADARVEAERIAQQAKEAAANARGIADALNAQRAREEQARAEQLVAAAAEKVEAAERLFADAKAEAERIVAEARENALNGTDLLSRVLLETEAPMSPPVGFQMVARGYDRAQVDAHIRELEATRDSAAARLTELEQRFLERNLKTPVKYTAPGLLELHRRMALTSVVTARNHGDMSHLGRWISSPPPVPSQFLAEARQGYDRAQVEQRIRQLMEERDRALARAATVEALMRPFPEAAEVPELPQP